MRNTMMVSLVVGALLVAGPALAQQPPAYGEQIDIAQAKKAAAAASRGSAAFARGGRPDHMVQSSAAAGTDVVSEA